MRVIATKNAPPPAGHYSQAIAEGGLLFVSGQLPIDPVTGEKCTGGIEEQATLALSNVLAIVAAAGSSRERVLRTTAYVTDIELWPSVNEVYRRLFEDHRPARAVVPVKDLHHGLLIEIEAIAAL